jgi:ubiquinone biosynthesis protein
MHDDAATLTDSFSASIRRATRVVTRSVGLVAHVVGHVDRLVADVTRDSAQVATEAQALARDVTQTASRLGVTVRAMPRVTRVVSEAARLIALYKLRGPSDALHEQSARRAHELCVELRGGVLKIGQLVSCRVDLLPEPWIEWLARLQDRVPAVDTALIRARIEEELGRPIDELFASFDDTPLAAASIAQVHAARLHDGREVVVKVQVPGIEDVVEADLVSLRLVAGMLGDLLPFGDLPTVLDELARAVRAELDYGAEADAMRAARLSFAAEASHVGGRVRVPEPVAELSSRRVLVMERLYGQSLTSFLDECEQRGEAGTADRDRVLETLVAAYAAQILAHGRFQADAHPGNFLVLPSEKGPILGLLDFGCVQTLSPAMRRAYAGVVGAVLKRDAAELATRLGEMGFATKSGDDTALRAFAEMMLGALRDGADLSAIDPKAQLDEALRLARENPVVHVPQEFVLIGRVFASLGGMILRYKPRLSLFAALAPSLAVALRVDRAA